MYVPLFWLHVTLVMSYPLNIYPILQCRVSWDSRFFPILLTFMSSINQRNTSFSLSNKSQRIILFFFYDTS